MWKTLLYSIYNGKIVLGNDPPFDGKPVLIRTNTGIVEAWWDEYGADGGWQWICYDDEFQCELDDVTHWMPLPDPPVSK